MSREHDYYIYMVTNFTRTVLYIGVTNSLVRRLWQHQRGETQGFTQRYHAARLVYFEHHRQVDDALNRERQLKGWSRAKKNALIAQMNPKWADLTPCLDPQGGAGQLPPTRDQLPNIHAGHAGRSLDKLGMTAEGI